MGLSAHEFQHDMASAEERAHQRWHSRTRGRPLALPSGLLADEARIRKYRQGAASSFWLRVALMLLAIGAAGWGIVRFLAF